MQTLVNLSSSRDVLKQVEINQASLNRLQDYFKSYRDALEYQLTVRSGDMMEVLTGRSQQMNNANASPSLSSVPSMFGAPSMSSTAPVRGISRRKSVFPGTGNGVSSSGNVGGMNHAHGSSNNLQAQQQMDNAISTAVIQLKLKVLTYNDRYVLSLCVSLLLIDNLSVVFDRLWDQLQDAVSFAASDPYDKHVDVLMKSSALCRTMGGIVSILCKSGM